MPGKLRLFLPIAAAVLSCHLVSPAAPFIAGSGFVGAENIGELLLAELNCVACHAADEAVERRLASKGAPRLGSSGLQLTPQFLRAFLTNPQAEKSGTTMPDLLHGRSGGDKAESVEALVHYLASVSQTNLVTPIGADQFKIQRGRVLFHQVGCVGCHAPQEPAPVPGGDMAAPEDAPADFRSLTNSSVPLGNLAAKTTVNELARFLVDPLKVRPSGRMPSLNLAEPEALAIAMYLLRDQAAGAGGVRAKVRGLSYEYFEGHFKDTLALDQAKAQSSGLVDRFTLAPLEKRKDNTGLRFTGFITIPAGGTYTFYSSSDDGTRLYVGTKEVVENDGTHGTTEKSGTVDLKAGEHPIMLTWFNGGGEATLKVSYEGPGINKQEIPAEILATDSGQPMFPTGYERFVPDPGKAGRGRDLFASLGCAACHEVGGEKLNSTLAAHPLPQLNPASTNGCLGDPVGRSAPDYALTSEQREALRKALATRERLAVPRLPRDEVRHAFAAFNCLACHARDEVGGPAGVRLKYFSTLGDLDLGDEGRIPPHLTRVGDKLRTPWLRDVLLNKGVARPYMATRMPQYGERNVGHLVETIEKADYALVDDAEVDPADAKWGRRLVGTSGFACIACHTFAEHKSLGIPAVDLTTMTRRLREDWFHRYLLDPPSLRPGTRMPTFWPDGTSTRPDVLAGDTERQIHAIWAYLLRGREGGLPPGLIQGKMEIVPDQEPAIYRHWITGAGARAIGVGYPEKVNLAFDAENLRLALLWQGPFIDAARHRTGRGDGSQGPLGYNVIKLPSGPPFAILPDADAPWPSAAGSRAGYKMRGYVLDGNRRPVFHYRFNEVEVTDASMPVPADIDATILRTLTFRTDAPVAGLFFRAWVGSKIEAQGQWFIADGNVKLRFGGATAMVRQSGGKSELLVPIVFSGTEARLLQEIVW